MKSVHVKFVKLVESVIAAAATVDKKAMIHLSAGVADSRRRTLTGGDDQFEHVRAGIVHEDFVGHERRLAIYRPTRHKVSWHFDILFNRYTAHKVDFVIVRPT